MSKLKWEIVPYQNAYGKWIPKVLIFVEENGETKSIPLESPEFEYDEQKEAERHALYLAKEYAANK